MSKHFFPNEEKIRALYNDLYKVTFSKHFFDFMDRNIISIIKKKTGLSPSPQLTFGFAHLYDTKDLYQPGKISTLKHSIGIANTVGHNVSFCWRSKIGDIVHLDNETFDENDIECWMEGLDAQALYRDLSLYGNKQAPFKMKNLPFQLDIRDYAYTMDVIVVLNKPDELKLIADRLDVVITEFNELADHNAKDEFKKPQLLAVHNWLITTVEENSLKIYLDAASAEILKEITKSLKTYTSVIRVEMDLPS